VWRSGLCTTHRIIEKLFSPSGWWHHCETKIFLWSPWPRLLGVMLFGLGSGSVKLHNQVSIAISCNCSCSDRFFICCSYIFFEKFCVLVFRRTWKNMMPWELCSRLVGRSRMRKWWYCSRYCISFIGLVGDQNPFKLQLITSPARLRSGRVRKAVDPCLSEKDLC